MRLGGTVIALGIYVMSFGKAVIMLGRVVKAFGGLKVKLRLIVDSSRKPKLTADDSADLRFRRNEFRINDNIDLAA